MRKIVKILIMIGLINSCGSNDIEVQDKDVLLVPPPSLVTNVVLVDSEYNDCLNPESPSYFGAEYIEGIEFLVLKDGVKQVIQLPFYNYPEGPAPYFWRLKENDAFLTAEDIAYMTYIRPPKFWSERYGYMDTENTRGYYYVYLSGHCFIRYPDGSEEELNVQYSGDELNKKQIEKVWINEELAYESGNLREKEFYYNPKYFPWMKSIFDGSKNREIPDIGGKDLFFVIKR